MTRLYLCPTLVFLLGACATSTPRVVVPSERPDESEAPAPTKPKPESKSVRTGSITYLTGGTLFRMAITKGALPVNLSMELNKTGLGKEEYLGVSRNGAFMTLSTTRYSKECLEWACLAVIDSEMQGQSVIIGNVPVRPAGPAAISGDGKRIIYSSDEGPHAQDLFVIDQDEKGQWKPPALITNVSPHAFNTHPVLSADATRVLFDCGPVAYGQAGTGICEILVDGLLLSTLVVSSENPLGSEGEFLAHHADYMPDGSIVFEADWDGSQLWYLNLEGESKPVRLNKLISNDNRPCGLPGGFVASLWLDRPGSLGVSELKIAPYDGTEVQVLTPSTDIAEHQCHETYSVGKKDADSKEEPANESKTQE